VAGDVDNFACVLVTAGGALTVTVALAVTLVSFTEVAVRVAVPVAPFAVKVTDPETPLFVSEVEVHAVPVHAQVTPCPPPCCTLTVMLTD
jgi:hypothetical protein